MVNLQHTPNDPVVHAIFMEATQRPITVGELEHLFTVARHTPDLNVIMPRTRASQMPIGPDGVGIYRTSTQRLRDRNIWRPITRIYGSMAATASFTRFPVMIPNVLGVMTFRGTICQRQLPNGRFLRREVYRLINVPGVPNLGVNLWNHERNGFAIYRFVDVNMHDEEEHEDWI